EENEERYRLLLENAQVGVVVIQDDAVRFANPTALAIMGQQRAAASDLWSAAFFQSLVSEGDQGTSDSLVEKLLSEPSPGSREVQIVPPDGSPRWLEMTGAPLDWQPKPATMLVFSDVTERKKTEREREKLITDLVDALGRFKTLRGLVPICSSCKMIRDDQGAWHQVEEFVRRHSEAEFTHGICPDCSAKHYAPPVAGSDDPG
ncbi:MAG: PAS domain S-box protein, partial [Proteobacteria bacterium]|nr:PAS domain S-box protein [Pseudomonadota bacterium]